MTSLPVAPVPCLTDNYAWCFATAEGEAAVVDPGQAGPVERWLGSTGLRLRHILLTHHHHDHTGGAWDLHHRTGAEITGARADLDRLPAVQRAVADGDELELGSLRARVLAVPGHTRGHIAFVVQDALFAGDALFAFGCGRLFEGTAEQMWASLDRLRRLPGDTRLCCGHEYTAANLRFARHLLPEDPHLAEAAQRCDRARTQSRPTVPTPMAEQAALNPFLRCDEPGMLSALQLAGRPPAEVFAHIRRRKDQF